MDVIIEKVVKLPEIQPKKEEVLRPRIIDQDEDEEYSDDENIVIHQNESPRKKIDSNRKLIKVDREQSRVINERFNQNNITPL